MGTPGPAPKPYLQVVREGNPGQRKVEPGVVLPPADLDEPDWLDTFPIVPDPDEQAVNRRAREVARREWRRVAPVLKHSAGLAEVDATLLHDYCVCVARIDQCEREISTGGLLIKGERGWQKNGATTIVGQYRTQLRSYIGELGLSPSARTRLTPPKGPGDDEGDPFD
jgi:P27 family predicted phage terminase small subunit